MAGLPLEEESADFQAGYGLGSDLAWYDAYEQVKAAYEAGEIELWLEWQHPKSMADWIEWEAKHGDHDTMTARWKK